MLETLQKTPKVFDRPEELEVLLSEMVQGKKLEELTAQETALLNHATVDWYQAPRTTKNPAKKKGQLSPPPVLEEPDDFDIDEPWIVY